MKTKNKIAIATLLLCGGLVTGVGFGAMGNQTAYAEEQSTSVFEVQSAALRIPDATYGEGIRFTIVMDKDTYVNENVANLTTGVLLMPAYAMDAEGLVVESENTAMMNITEGVYWSEEDGVMKIFVHLYNIPETEYTTDVSIRAYVDDNDASTTPMYTDVATSSVAKTAAWLYENDDLTEEEKATLKATYLTYDVFFHDGEDVEETTGVYGEKISAPEVADKEGYTFGGWWNKAGTAQWNFAETTISGTTTNLYAKWNINTYTAKIVRADGNEETVEFTIENRAEKLAEIALTANNAQYTYSWVSALPSELALNNDQVFTEKRDVNNYTVTFDTDGGSVIEAQTVPYGTPASELANFTSTKAGYKFMGWTLENGAAIPDGATVTSNITVKAKWMAIVRLTNDCVIELSAASAYDFTKLGITDTVEYIGFLADESDKVAYAGYAFTAENTTVGERDMYIYTADAIYVVNAVFATEAFGQADAATMFATINANPAGYYVLAEDITFSTVITKAGTGFGAQSGKTPSQHNCEVYNNFTGTFDGRGYGLYNLKIKQTNANNSGVCVFGIVTGTICNMYVELIDVTEVANNNGPRGLTYRIEGTGKVHNVFLDWTVSHFTLGSTVNYYPCGGITTMLNVENGAVNNIVRMTYGTDVTNTAATIGAIAGQTSLNSSTKYGVNYVISSGTVVKQVGNQAWYANRNFVDNATFLEEVTELSANAGWSKYWTLENDTLYMNGVALLDKTVPAVTVTVTFDTNGGSEVESKTVEQGDTIEQPADPTKDGCKFMGWYLDGIVFTFDTPIESDITLVAKWFETIRLDTDCVIELSAASAYDFTKVGITDTVEYIGFLDDETDKVAYAGYMFTADNTNVGEREMYVYTANAKYVVNAVFATEAFGQADAATMFATINANPAGYYVLAEDITFSTVITKAGTGFGAQSGKTPSQHNCEVYNNFTGMFDGRGYGLYNLKIKQTNANNSGVCVFGIVTGTICNMYVELIDVTEVANNNGPRGLTYRIEGTGKVHNVFLDWTVAKYTLGNSANYYPCGGITTMLNVENGAVNNIVRMTYATDVTNTAATIGAIAGQTSLNSSTKFGVNYVISSGTVVKQVGNQAWYANRNFANDAKFLEGVTSLSAAAGWSKYWTLENGSVKLGDKVVITAA